MLHTTHKSVFVNTVELSCVHTTLHHAMRDLLATKIRAPNKIT